MWNGPTWCVRQIAQYTHFCSLVAGGYTPNPTYEEVCTGSTGHTEAVLVAFDPAKVSLDEVLRTFWEGHDPTQGMRQGNDVGSSYRSAIFYTSDEQKRIAEDTIADVDASGLWPGKAVTEVVPAGDFWEAEPEPNVRSPLIQHSCRPHTR